MIQTLKPKTKASETFNTQSGYLVVNDGEDTVFLPADDISVVFGEEGDYATRVYFKRASSLELTDIQFWAPPELVHDCLEHAREAGETLDLREVCLGEWGPRQIKNTKMLMGKVKKYERQRPA